MCDDVVVFQELFSQIQRQSLECSARISEFRVATHIRRRQFNSSKEAIPSTTRVEAGVDVEQPIAFFEVGTCRVRIEQAAIALKVADVEKLIVAQPGL